MSLFSKLAVFPAVLLAGACLFVLAGPVPADPKEKETPPQAIYHKDREHLWNRVHSVLFVRTGPDGRSYGEDRLEPLLWSESTYLLHGKTADRATAVLEEFLRNKGESLIDDPLKWAILQRDLWLVSNWLAGKPDDDARKRLDPLLSKVIRRLALTRDQIAKLPDSYAATVAAKRYADGFDAGQPERSYLPADMFKTDGPWVCVGRTDGPTAPFHLREGGDSRFTNSVFLVFLKLPGGRDKTLEFLKTLAAFDKPLLLANADEKTKRSFTHLPNPALPQWPKGTEVALVRRAMLIDSSRRVIASPLTESVQLRAMSTDAPALKAETIDKIAARKGTGGQAFAEFRLSRVELFGGKTGGLRDVSEERDFKTGFNSHPWDEFDQPPNKDRPFPQRAMPFANNRASCIACHSAPGVYGFNSVPVFAFGLPSIVRNDDDKKLKPRMLAAMAVEKVENAAVEWKERQPGWVALRTLLPE
jgi:hypothetical protein